MVNLLIRPLLKASQVKQLDVFVPQMMGVYLEIGFLCGSSEMQYFVLLRAAHGTSEVELLDVSPAFIKSCFQSWTKKELPVVSKRCLLSHLPNTTDLCKK